MDTPNAVIILGSQGFLGSRVAVELETRGIPVLPTGRRVSMPFVLDVTVTTDWIAAQWLAWLTSAGVSPEDVRAIINCVTQKNGSAAAVENTNAAGVWALAGLASAIRAAGGIGLAMHIGSAAEFRDSYLDDVYAHGKRAARLLCRQLGVDLVLTFGVIVGPVPRSLRKSNRLVLSMLPNLLGTMVLNVAEVVEAAATVADLAVGWPIHLPRGVCVPTELAFIGYDRLLGKILQLGQLTRRSLTERVVLEFLARAPTCSPCLRRLSGFARVALGRARNHYQFAGSRALALHDLEQFGGARYGQSIVLANDSSAGRRVIRLISSN